MSNRAATAPPQPSVAIPETHMAAWKAFLRAQSRVLQTLDQELQEATGLSLAWYDVLFQLHDAGGAVRAGDLSALLVISPSAGTRLVDRMARKSLVERFACESDRRVVWVSLTDEGLEALRKAAPIHLAGVVEHFTGHLSRSQATLLTKALAPVVAAVESSDRR